MGTDGDFAKQTGSLFRSALQNHLVVVFSLIGCFSD